MTTARDLDERFRTGAQKYAAYLETPEGRLRTDAAFANLQEFLPSLRAERPSHVLDLGCGTGAIGIRLARLGYRVSLLDSSEAMLDIARHAAEDAGVADRVTIHHGDVSELANLPATCFDVITCHNVLEFVGNPEVVVQVCARALRDQSALLSLVVRNQAGEVLKAALGSGDLAGAEANLTAEWGYESLYGEQVRLFTSDALSALLKAEALTAFAERGIRIVADYLPSNVSREEQYEQILGLEKRLSRRPDFARVARHLHVLARLQEARA